MSDFSVPCILSGLPIAVRSPVVGFKIRKARYEDADIPFGPVSLPFTGFINGYGYIDGRDDRNEKGTLTVFAHVSLFELQGEIFAKAMPKKGALYAEMVERKHAYREMLAKHTKLGVGQSETEDFCRRYTVRDNMARSDNEPWLALMHHLLLCVSESATFKIELSEWLFDLVISDAFEADADKAKADIDSLQQLLCVFAATRITGHPIRPPGYCFDQYPTFKWETMWHAEVAAVSRRYNKIDKQRTAESAQEDLSFDIKYETDPVKKAKLRQKFEANAASCELIKMDFAKLEERIAELPKHRARFPMQKELDELSAKLRSPCSPETRRDIKNQILTLSFQCGIA